jgi:cob(I)alamin adenosyltransferase
MAAKRIYTRGGDGGETSLAGGQRVRKDSPRIACCGAVDELNSFLGLARSTAEAAGLARLSTVLLRIQHELFNLGAVLAAPSGDRPGVPPADVARIEGEIDALSTELPPLDSFVLPGGARLNAELHLCRTVCRRAERSAVALAAQEPVPGEVLQYLNRLSDALFVFARWANLQLAAPETLWDPNRPAPA